MYLNLRFEQWVQMSETEGTSETSENALLLQIISIFITN